VETSRTPSGGHIEEVLIPVDPAVTKFDRIAKIHDLQKGDRIRVHYRQKYLKQSDDEWVLSGAVATKITFLGHSLGTPGLRGGTDGGGS
jgi:hypothetical protein